MIELGGIFDWEDDMLARDGIGTSFVSTWVCAILCNNLFFRGATGETVSAEAFFGVEEDDGDSAMILSVYSSKRRKRLNAGIDISFARKLAGINRSFGRRGKNLELSHWRENGNGNGVSNEGSWI